jgi:hypothetical protein
MMAILSERLVTLLVSRSNSAFGGEGGDRSIMDGGKNSCHDHGGQEIHFKKFTSKKPPSRR